MGQGSHNRGFTLVEMIVVIVIIGIFAVLFIPQYSKTVESSKADEALSTVQMVATANRLYALQNNQTYTSGLLIDACSDPTQYCCSTTPGCATTATSPCNLVQCGYLSAQQFDGKPYVFYSANAGASAADPCSLGVSGTFSACTKRANGAAPGTTQTPFSNWGYTVDQNGNAVAQPTTNGPPSPPTVVQ